MMLSRQWPDAPDYDEPCWSSLGFLYLFLAAFIYVAAHDTLWVLLEPYRRALRWVDGVRRVA